MNLSNAIMGAGALALPNLFKVVGVVPGLALLLFAWLWTWFSMAIMIQAADAVSKRVLRGEPVGSYEDLMAHTLGPRGRTASTVGIVSLQIGCLVGFANVLADVVSPFADEMLPPGLEPNRSAILAAVALGGMLPTGLLVGGESHALLATVSKAALGVVATFAAVLVAHAFSPRRVIAGAGAGSGSIEGPGGFTDQAAAAIAVDGADAIAWFAPLTGLTSVLPLAIFAFGAHPAVLPVVRAVRCEGGPGSQVRSISHWSPYDRVGVVNADP
jgi:amino acid permease